HDGVASRVSFNVTTERGRDGFHEEAWEALRSYPAVYNGHRTLEQLAKALLEQVEHAYDLPHSLAGQHPESARRKERYAAGITALKDAASTDWPRRQDLGPDLL